MKPLPTLKPKAQIDLNQPTRSGGDNRGGTQIERENTLKPKPQEIDLKLSLDRLTLQQAQYVILKLVGTGLTDATCAVLAGYSTNSPVKQAQSLNRKTHIARILREASRNRTEAENVPKGDVAREEILKFYAQLLRDDLAGHKLRLEAAKALRELEAMDKNSGSNQPHNVLAVILNQIDGHRSALPASNVPMLEAEIVPKAGQHEAI